MSNEEQPPPVPYPPAAAMNFSNANFERVSGRIERNRDDRLEQGMPMMAFDTAAALKGHPSLQKPPGTQYLAASTLAGFTKPAPSVGEDYLHDDDPDCDFKIPLRFTKSGRRRATPFPMKVRFEIF